MFCKPEPCERNNKKAVSIIICVRMYFSLNIFILNILHVIVKVNEM